MGEAFHGRKVLVMTPVSVRVINTILIKEVLVRDSPDQTNFPGYSSFWDTVNYNPAFQGRPMRPNSLKFPVFI